MKFTDAFGHLTFSLLLVWHFHPLPFIFDQVCSHVYSFHLDRLVGQVAEQVRDSF